MGPGFWVYSGIIARPVELTSENVDAVLEYGKELFVIGRLATKDGDLLNDEKKPVIGEYKPNVKHDNLLVSTEKYIKEEVAMGEKITAWLIGAACQVVNVHAKDNNKPINSLNPCIGWES